jgi:hypothetical protein
MRASYLFAIALLTATLGCSAEGMREPGQSKPGTSKSCDAIGLSGSPLAEQDLAHFVFHDGAWYYARLPQAGPPLALGSRLGAVTCTVKGSSTPWDRAEPVEGAAGYVPEGTPIFSLQACPVSVAIAARYQERDVVFVRKDAAEDVDGNWVQPPKVRVPSTCKEAIRRVEP